jgi:hypothetical protein
MNRLAAAPAERARDAGAGGSPPGETAGSAAGASAPGVTPAGAAQGSGTSGPAAQGVSALAVGVPAAGPLRVLGVNAPGTHAPAMAARGIVTPPQPAPATELSAEQAVQVLQGWQHNARTALQWLHRDWLMTALGHAPDAAAPESFEAALGALLARCDESCSLAVLRVLLPAPPSLDTFCTERAARFDALPVETGLRVLRMQALLARRSEMRRLIDRATRTRLAGWIGCKLDDLLAAAAPEPQPLADTKRARAAARPLALLDADELAFEGLALLPRAGAARSGAAAAMPGLLPGSPLGLHAASPGAALPGLHGVASASASAPAPLCPLCPLLRLALPRRDAAPHETAPPSDAEREDSFALLSVSIATLLPEYPWLSG